MGDSPRISDPLDALAAARAAFDEADDFTMAVEEEFAILDPETLEMTSGFEQLAAAAARRPSLDGMIAGELMEAMQDNYSKWSAREGIKNLPEIADENDLYDEPE